ncbi:MAG TPA: YciI family protein [Gammaproteobacteria bacterium]|nr:YciI family protein [Gammaproteobacteria bacterium]
MSSEGPLHDYLLLSRGHWDADLSPVEIQKVIDEFYVWYERLLGEGKFKPGQRLAREGKTVHERKVTDGPFTESKEIIGGYWFIVARSLEEAAAIAAQSPCLACGLYYEIRPIDLSRPKADDVTCETPAERRAVSRARSR